MVKKKELIEPEQVHRDSCCSNCDSICCHRDKQKKNNNKNKSRKGPVKSVSTLGVVAILLVSSIESRKIAFTTSSSFILFLTSSSSAQTRSMSHHPNLHLSQRTNNGGTNNGIPIPTTLPVVATKNTNVGVSSYAATNAKNPLKIAIIGAGAAGLVAARIVSRSCNDTIGHHPTVTVLEKDPSMVGGIWCYQRTDENENEKETANNNGKEQHQAHKKDHPMYRGLRTNLPKEVMQYREYPWVTSKEKQQEASASFVTHVKVAKYLRDYAAHFGLDRYIQFGACVRQLTILDDKDSASCAGVSTPSSSSSSSSKETWPKIRLDWETTTLSTATVTTSTTSQHQYHSDIFDAVYVCNGHYSQPSSPTIPGMDQYFHGTSMHSISYDDPQVFAGQTVLCIGGRASGSDLAREISFYAKQVWVSDTTCTTAERVVVDDADNDDVNDNETYSRNPPISGVRAAVVTIAPQTVAVRPDGSIQFAHDCPLQPIPDTIIFCTGYDYSFPFINHQSNLKLHVIPGERRVSPLYKQLVSAIVRIAATRPNPLPAIYHKWFFSIILLPYP
jgi:hypothetical protein